MTAYTPEKVNALVVEARGFVDGSTENARTSLIRDLTIALATVSAERDTARIRFANELTRKGVHTFSIHDIRRYAEKENE